MDHIKGLVDSTLREGGQTVGVAFDLEAKVRLAGLISGLGIEEVEVGVAAPAETDLPELVRRCRGEAGVRRLALWCRCRAEDIDFAAGVAPDVLSLSVPVSDLHIQAKFQRDRAWVLESVAQGVRRARSRVPFVSLGLEDATRADRGFLHEVVRAALAAGVDRIRLADTVGVATPALVADLVRGVSALGDFAVGVHMHNDFGMATANAVAALEAGAHWADVTLLGLGERAGNSRLEEVAAYLALRCGRPYATEKFGEAARVAASIAGRGVEAHHPVVGAEIFSCETGLHLMGLERDPRTYEPYDPAHVGARRRALFGGKVGRHGVRSRLAQLGLSCGEGNLPGMTAEFRNRAQRLGRPLKDGEVLALAAEFGG